MDDIAVSRGHHSYQSYIWKNHFGNIGKEANVEERKATKKEGKRAAAAAAGSKVTACKT